MQSDESFIVHVVPVDGARAAGGYMAKYMGKEFDKARAGDLGMKRRFSVNRSWPREPRGLTEAGAETPFEEATVLLRTHMDPSVLEVAGGIFKTAQVP